MLQCQHGYWQITDDICKMQILTDKSCFLLVLLNDNRHNLKLYLTKSYLYLHLCTDIWQMMTKSISTFVLRIGRWLQICAWQITLWSYLKKSRLYLNLCTGIWQMISRSLFITNMYLQVLFLFQHPYWQLKMISNFPFNRQVVLISDFNWQIMIWFQYPYWSLIFNHYSYMVKICQVQ